MDDIRFKCTECGSCCKNENLHLINKEYWGLEVTEEGHCANLTQDGKCKIYDSRPLICRVEDIYYNLEKIKEVEPRLYNQFAQFRTKTEFYIDINKKCNTLMDIYGVDSSFKIDIEKTKKEYEK